MDLFLPHSDQKLQIDSNLWQNFDFEKNIFAKVPLITKSTDLGSVNVVEVVIIFVRSSIVVRKILISTFLFEILAAEILPRFLVWLNLHFKMDSYLMIFKLAKGPK